MEEAKYNETEECLQKISRIDPNFMKHLLFEIQGDIVLKRDDKNIEGAIKLYKLSSLANPNYFDVYLKMGKCFEKDKDFENATKMFQKAVELNDRSPWAHFRLGWVYVRNNERNKGIEHLKKSLQYNPDNIDVLAKLGEVLLRD